jgi:hypothetical protein
VFRTLTLALLHSWNVNSRIHKEQQAPRKTLADCTQLKLGGAVSIASIPLPSTKGIDQNNHGENLDSDKQFQITRIFPYSRSNAKHSWSPDRVPIFNVAQLDISLTGLQTGHSCLVRIALATRVLAVIFLPTSYPKLLSRPWS